VFEHDALLYDGPDGFVEHVLPFVRGGFENDEPVLAVTGLRNAAALRDELGRDAALVDYRDSADWYASPGKAFNGYADYVARHGGEPRLRVIGEPVWPLEWREGVDEWARYESALNVAFVDAPAWIVCPYDTTTLPDAILEHARHTHPTLHAHGERVAHDEYVETQAFWSALDSASPFAPAARARLLPITADLAGLRAALAVEARRFGVPRQRVHDLLLAVHELAINALTHGGGEAALAMWSEGDTFVCEVTDGGPGVERPLVGYQIPAADAPRGRGFWLARRLCDLVEVRSRPGGTRVRVHLRRA
jgi:anti-sigma regulatory factor (Ser/Thr protein kinase)